MCRSVLVLWIIFAFLLRGYRQWNYDDNDQILIMEVSPKVSKQLQFHSSNTLSHKEILTFCIAFWFSTLELILIVNKILRFVRSNLLDRVSKENCLETVFFLTFFSLAACQDEVTGLFTVSISCCDVQTLTWFLNSSAIATNTSKVFYFKTTAKLEKGQLNGSRGCFRIFGGVFGGVSRNSVR